MYLILYYNRRKYLITCTCSTTRRLTTKCMYNETIQTHVISVQNHNIKSTVSILLDILTTDYVYTYLLQYMQHMLSSHPEHEVRFRNMLYFSICSICHPHTQNMKSGSQTCYTLVYILYYVVCHPHTQDMKSGSQMCYTLVYIAYTILIPRT